MKLDKTLKFIEENLKDVDSFEIEHEFRDNKKYCAIKVAIKCESFVVEVESAILDINQLYTETTKKIIFLYKSFKQMELDEEIIYQERKFELNEQN